MNLKTLDKVKANGQTFYCFTLCEALEMLFLGISLGTLAAVGLSL